MELLGTFKGRRTSGSKSKLLLTLKLFEASACCTGQETDIDTADLQKPEIILELSDRLVLRKPHCTQ